jgi:predicted secreted Zn-dependent protease
VTAIRPRWRDEKQGSAALRERWKGLVAAIDRYQAEHKQQALAAGREIEDAINNLEPTKSCEALTEAANEAAAAILERHKQASREYDERTNYGRNNGVSLI